MRVLLIEDDISTAQSINLALLAHDIHCTLSSSGHDGIQYALASKYDIILLDMMLPDAEGTEIIHSLRQSKVETPILILSAINHPDQKIKALQLGADDYMTKPFNISELIARLKAINKRAHKSIKSIVTIGKITIDFNLKTIHVLDTYVKLTDKEYGLIELLALTRTRFTTKEHIMAHLYGNSQDIPMKIINVFVCRVRRKLEKASGGYNFIQTVWGMGYRLLDEGELVTTRRKLFAPSTSRRKRKNTTTPVE